MKILMSACLVGDNVMYAGDNFLNDFIKRIIEHSEVEIVKFCPEHSVLGTPRNNMLIHDGDGFDVLEGRAKILDTESRDCTEVMMEGAHKMLNLALRENPDLVILTEGSDSCGSNIILDPETESNGKYQFKKGMGLAAALLKKHGFNIMGHMNEVKIEELLNSKLSDYSIRSGLKRLEEMPFYPKEEGGAS